MQTEAQKRSIQNRLNRLEGQLRGINRMIGENKDCSDVLQQLTAARSALQSTIEAYLAVTVNQCLLSDDVDAETRRKLAAEMLSVIHKA